VFSCYDERCDVVKQLRLEQSKTVKLVVHLNALTNSVSASQKTQSKLITKMNRLVTVFTITPPPPHTPHTHTHTHTHTHCREPASPQLLYLFLNHFSVIMASKHISDPF